MWSDSGDPVLPASPEKLSTLETWRMALTQPNEQTFQRIREDPAATMGRAIGWIAFGSGFAYTLGAMGQLFFIQTLPLSSFLEGAEAAFSGRFLAGMSSLFILAYGLPITVLASVLGALIFVGGVHFIAGVFGGSGSFGKLLYAFAAISAPSSIVSALLGLIPIVNCLTIPLALYVLVLNLLAIKVVQRISWGAAAGIFMILLTVFVLIVVVVGMALWIPLQEFLRSPGFLPSDLY